MNKIVYKNLGTNFGDRMMYIRSTDIETMNWESLLMSFSDEALYFLCKGKSIIIEDRCIKPKGKVQRIFCPAFSDFLRMLTGKEPINKTVQEHSYKAFRVYKNNKRLKRKYNFYRNRLTNFHVRGRTIKVKREVNVFD
jgi:hypothetical protein